VIFLQELQTICSQLTMMSAPSSFSLLEIRIFF
jgi:hypothetical protein